MIISFGPVPAWSAPLRDKVLFGLVLVAVLVLFDRIRSGHQKGSSRDIVVMAILIAIICAVLVFFRFARH